MSASITALLTGPLIVFMVIVAPIWLILHYRSKQKINEGFSENEAIQLIELARKAEQLKERVRALERILDQEHPDWRKYN